MARDIQQLRNIGIIAHIDAGKTTLTERMLYYAGARHFMGEVDKGTTETDFDAEEQERGITIYSAAVTFPWKDVTINLIDTPGHVDFTAEVERSLRVLDGGVVVFSAREGVEAQSETVWRQADHYHVPRVAFINKMDREGADFFATLEQIRKRLGHNPVAIQIPIGAGPPHVQNAFAGIIDLVEMKRLEFIEQPKGGKVVAKEIPEQMLEEAELWRGQMLEQLYEFSDEMMQLALEEKPVPPELVRRVLREATLGSLAVPVMCGSALDKVGVQPVLDAVQHYLPSPADLPPVEGNDPKAKKQPAPVRRSPDAAEPFCGLVFKVVADKHGYFYFVRVYSGHLKASTRVYNPNQDKKENAAQLWHVQADKREQVQSVEAGDIVGVIGLRDSITGDTLCDSKQVIQLPSIEFPETVISMAIEPETTADRKKLADRLELLKRQDPTFRARENEETGQTLVSGMGELHLEVIKNKLLREFNLNVKVHNPRVSYRESIQKAVTVTGECHRQMAGTSLFASLRIRMEPQPEGQSVVPLPAAAESLPGDLLSVALEALREQGEGGGSLGFPLVHFKITVEGGEWRDGESNDVAFRIAAADAFDKALQQAGIVLLEPIMKLEVSTPEEFLGEFVSDLQQRRAEITRTETRGKSAVIEARVPLANLFGYSSAMRSLSQGRASSSMEPSHYGPAPPDVLEGFL